MSQDWSASVPTFTNDAESDIGTMRLMFATLRSGFSGTTAPASPVAGQGWIDTTTHIFKIRNETNTAWISVYDLANSKPLGKPDTATLADTATNALSLGGILAEEYAQLTNATGSQTFTSNGNFTVPVGVKAIFITGTAGGGGGGKGGYSAALNESGGGGGASGSMVSGCPIIVTPGEVIAITLGAGGSAGTSGAGGTGGNTTIGSYITLTGGAGGSAGATGSPPAAASGGAGSNKFPSLSLAGGSAGVSDGSALAVAGSSSLYYSGGGAAGGQTGGGGGAAGLFGAGAAGGNAGAGAAAAVNTGGGGGGGAATNPGQSGGAGGSGKVIIQW